MIVTVNGKITSYWEYVQINYISILKNDINRYHHNDPVKYGIK